MFIFPDEAITYKEYKTINTRSNSLKDIRKWKENGYVHAHIENPQTWKLIGKKTSTHFYSKNEGFIIPSSIKLVVTKIPDYRPSAFVYLEILGNSIAMTAYDSQGLLHFDHSYDINEQNVDSAFFEMQVAINKLIKQDKSLTIYFAQGNKAFTEHQETLLDKQGEKYRQIADSVSKSKLSITDNQLRFCDAALVLITDSASETESESDEVEVTEAYNVTYINADRCLLTEITINSALELPFDGYSSARTRHISIIGRKARNVRLVYFGAFFVIVGVYNFMTYTLHQQKIAEQERLRKSSVKIESPWRAYRQDITNPNKNTQAEYALTKAYEMLHTFDSAAVGNYSLPLGWIVNEFVMSGSLMTIFPSSVGGTNKQLSDLARKLSLRQRTSQKGVQIDALFISKAIEQSAYMTSVEGETNYIADAMNWLFDDITVTTENQIVNGSGVGQYRIHLVKIAFQCWLPEDFLYASTQFAKRNYALHSIKAKNVEFMEGGSQCNLGFSGEVNLQVFGNN